MSHFRFIHAADIHLGSLLHIDSPDEQISEYARRAVYDAFERICMTAIEQGVEFILIAGDLYDSDTKNVFANQFFIQMCNLLRENDIKIYGIAGNHDPLNKQWEYFKLPDNVFVLAADKHEVYMVKKEGETIARIVGQSYKTKWESRSVYKEFDMQGDGLFNIAMLHTQLDPSDRKYTPATAAELIKNSHIHYWALGHVHKPQIINSEGPVIAYPGIPQGRDFGEEGVGGAYLVEVDGSDIVSMSYITASSVVYMTIEIDISSETLRTAESLNELEEYILYTAQSLPAHGAGKCPVDLPQISARDEAESIAGYVVRWVIKGRGELHDVLKDLLEDAESELARGLRKQLSGLSPFVWTDSIQIRTAMPITKDILAEHSRIIDMLDDTMTALFDDEVKASSLKGEMGGLWTMDEDPEDRDEFKFYLDDETFKVMNEHAKQLILEKLLDRAGE